MNSTIGSSLISISFRSGEKLVRLTNPAEWELAVSAGEISPTSMVVVEHGVITEAVDAREIEALAAYFPAPTLTPVRAVEFALAA